MNNITIPQRRFIQDIIRNITSIGFDIYFSGTTRKEASAFIEKYGNYSKDVNRLRLGKMPWWSMIVNKPPRHQGLHNFMIEQKIRMEIEKQQQKYNAYYDSMDYPSWDGNWR